VDALFASGRVVGLILALVVLEALLLIGYHRRSGRGIAPLDLLPNLLSGAFLLLALGAALDQARWEWIGLALLAALVAHAADLYRRWRI
jgi:hypothetical protein